jgi:general secretion pathway protein J
MRPADEAGEAGFTLLETLAAVAALAAIVSGLALITGQWLPNWRHGFANLQRVEAAGLGLDRLAADFAAAEYIRPDAQSPGPLFAGTAQSATFVRESLDPNSPPGLEIVRYAEVKDGQGVSMVRTRAVFHPGDANPAFGSPVIVAHAPFRVTLAYADVDRAWLDGWPEGDRLPSAVRITLKDAGSGAALAASTATLVHVTATQPAGAAASATGRNRDK